MLGPVSLLFNNAGVAARVPPEKLTYQLWDWCNGINLGGVINGIQTFLPRMIERGLGGHIVNTSSGAALAGSMAGTLYSTAKFAVLGMSETLNLELAPLGIGVSALCPGPTATGFIQRSAGAIAQLGTALSAEEEKMEADTHEFLQTGASPEEVGAMVLEAVKNNCLFIVTDRIFEEPVRLRTEAILNALPERASNPDLFFKKSN